MIIMIIVVISVFFSATGIEMLRGCDRAERDCGRNLQVVRCRFQHTKIEVRTNSKQYLGAFRSYSFQFDPVK